MTTIAWDGKSLSADSLSTSGNMVLSGNYKKIFRENKYRVGIAGDSAAALYFYKNYIENDLSIGEYKFNPINIYSDGNVISHTENNTDFAIMIIEDDSDICYIYNSSTGFWDTFNPPISIGSGSKYAMGALLSNNNSERSVEIACKLDVFSRLPIETLH